MSSASPDHHKKELARYHARRAAGLCGGCGQRPPEEGKARCVFCLYRVNASKIMPTRKNRATPWGEP